MEEGRLQKEECWGGTVFLPGNWGLQSKTTLLFVTSDENWPSSWEPGFRKLWHLFKSSFLLYYPRKKTLDMWPCLFPPVWFLWTRTIQIQAPRRKHSLFPRLNKSLPMMYANRFYCLVTLSSEACCLIHDDNISPCTGVCVSEGRLLSRRWRRVVWVEEKEGGRCSCVAMSGRWEAWRGAVYARVILPSWYKRMCVRESD